MRRTAIEECVLYLLILVGACSSPDQDTQQSGDAYFVHEVQPLLQSKCLSCHGEDPANLEGGLDLRTAAGLAMGGEEHAELIVSGRPEFSPLYQAVTREDPDFAMPPREREALTEEEIQVIYSWIVTGAPWPNEARQKELTALVSARKSRIAFDHLGGQSDAWNNRTYRDGDLWAYQPLVRPEIPEGYQDLHPIDAFIQKELDGVQLSTAPLAEPSELLKRSSYDLLGLPPNQAVRDSFVLQSGELKFEKLIDHLLESPHYGEQWARHWLDVVRYADSDGFANDYNRPSAWRYRDYVVRSMNDDKPYDDFVREQIAGDEINGQNAEYLVATGFLRMGPWEHTGMSVVAETRQFYLDDVTNIVGETFLATPLNCARCHDHKYDPIPTQDYYQVQAVFATTQFAQRKVPHLPEENLEFMDSERAQVEAWLDRLDIEEAKLVEKEEKAARAWYSTRGLAYKSKKERKRGKNANIHPPRYIGLSFEDLGYRKVLQKRRQIENRKLDRFEPIAYSTYSGPDRVTHSARPIIMPEEIDGDPAATFVLTGGSVYARDQEVGPGVLQVVHQHDSFFSPEFQDLSELTDELAGRRTDFAQWLTHPENPLFARTMVNRLWQWHFGEGLASNPNNFGATGGKPANPDLLDWLAAEFIEQGWSIKAMHRLIMTSAAYRRSSSHSDPGQNVKDPDNKMWSHFRPRRLAAEEIRDAMLAISGELNDNVGGIPIRPIIPLEVALQPRHTMGSAAPSYQPSSTPAERNRRSIYIERKRSVENPFLQTFNQNNSTVSCEERESSTVVTQAFGLLNSENVRRRALALANQLLQHHDLPKALVLAHENVLQRAINSEDRNRAEAYLHDMVDYHIENKPVPQALPVEVVHEMHEEMTGTAFHYTEYLDVHETLVPDIGDADVSVETRALADYIAVLFNTNEFIYVY